MDLSYMPVDPTEFPIEITFTINDVNYNIELRYNDVKEFYTILIKDSDGNNLYSSRINYLSDINHVVVDGMPITDLLKAFSTEDLLSEKTTAVSVDSDTFGETVQLYVIPEV